MFVFKLLNLSKDFVVFLSVFKVSTFNRPHIIKLRLQRFLCSLNFVHLLSHFLIKSLSLHALFISLFVEFLLLCLESHKSAGVLIIVFLEFLKLTSLLEKSFTSSTALILKNLFLLNISTLGSLLEFVTIVLITHFQMVKSVGKGLNLFFALTDFSIKFITIAL